MAVMTTQSNIDVLSIAAGDIFSSTDACFYQASYLDIDTALYSLPPDAEYPPVLSHSHHQNARHGKESRSTETQPKANVVYSGPVPDAGDIFSITDQSFYQVLGQETDVPLFDVSVEAPSSEDMQDVHSDSSHDKKPSKNSLRRRRQRERQRGKKKNDSPSKSPSPAEQEKNSSKSQGKLDKGKIKVPLKVDVKGKDTSGRKSPAEKGKKSPAVTAVTPDSGHRTPKLTNLQDSQRGINQTIDDSNKVAELERECIFPLKRRSKSLKFPRAKYLCRLCDYHCDDIPHANRHIKDNRHQKLKKHSLQELMLEHLPPATDIHTEALTRMLSKVVEQYALSDADRKNRQNVLHKLRTILFKSCPEAQLHMYGSSITDFGLKTSDLNLELTAENAPSRLKEMYLILKEDKSGYFSGVCSDFSASVPSILCTVPTYKLSVKISISVTNCRHCSLLLSTYSKIDPRVKQLGIPFRLWAKMVGIDKQESGTMPAYVFGMMTVFFLQQCKPPVLPVLHQIEKDTCTMGGVVNNYYFNDLDKLETVWKCENTESSGALWVKLCQFYAINLDVRETVVCIRQLDPVHRGDKKWTKRLPIEDPFQRKRNISRSISHSTVFDYICVQLHNLYQYYGIPQTKQGPIFKEVEHVELEHLLVKKLLSVVGRKSPRHSPSPADRSILETSMSEVPSSPDVRSKLQMVKSASQELLGDSEDEDETTPTSAAGHTTDLYSLAASIAESALSEAIRQTVHLNTPTKEKSPPVLVFDTSKLDSLEAGSLCFVFKKEVFCDDKGPPMICALCHKQGHLQQDCPDIRLPELVRLPPVTKKYKSMLDQILWKVPRDFEPTSVETQLRDNLRDSLEIYIRQKYKDARLHLFGSSCNGFGFSHSDMDICMVLENTSSENVNYVDVITTLSKHLKKHVTLSNVLAITTAKVPIVKFRHKNSGLDGDISLYNTLAVHNTRMLQTYSQIDYRVRALGYAVKVFAKLCGICDASKGSLSSYAYILMVLYFLQQRKPPVIPVLQELHTGEKPICEVDGWNAWFYNDLSSIASVWKDFGRNKESLGELWIGFLRFYTEEFNFKDTVISIRQKELLTRFEKLWNGKCVAIEDPFDLSHNLGGGLSKKMDAFIMKAFHNGRKLFGSSIDRMPPGYSTLEDYLFDPKLLTESAPPTDRNCRVCGKIGHWAKQCPTRKDRQEENRERKASPHVNADQTRAKDNSRSTPSKTDSKKDPSSGNKTPKTNGQAGKKVVSGTKVEQNPSKVKTGNAKVVEQKQIKRNNQTSSNTGKASGSKQPEDVKGGGKKKTESASSKPQASGRDKGGAETKDVRNKGPKPQQKAGAQARANEKGKDQDKSRKASKTPQSQNQSGKQNQQRDGKRHHHKPMVFYNKQHVSGNMSVPEPVTVTPRAVYINHNNYVQISPHQHHPNVPEPVQQFFHAYGSPQSRQQLPPMPLMDLQLQPPQFNNYGYRQVQPGYAEGVSGLTWQQAMLQQQELRSVNQGYRRKATKSLSEPLEEEFPTLEVTIPNEQFTWQQQQQYLASSTGGSHGKKRKKSGKAKKTPEANTQ